MKRKPTTERLAEELEKAGCPIQLIENARAGLYDDYKSPLATPIRTLVFDLTNAGYESLATRAIEGEFDAQKWEAEEWGNSPEGRETLAEFFRGIGKERRDNVQ